MLARLEFWTYRRQEIIELAAIRTLPLLHRALSRRFGRFGSASRSQPKGHARQNDRGILYLSDLASLTAYTFQYGETLPEARTVLAQAIANGAKTCNTPMTIAIGVRPTQHVDGVFGRSDSARCMPRRYAPIRRGESPEPHDRQSLPDMQADWRPLAGRRLWRHD
jgi:hypothetical protein